MSVDSLRYVVQCNITNDETKALLKQFAPRERGGRVFLSGSWGYDVLSGSPNGSGVVRMAGEHSPALGHKRILSVRVLWPGEFASLVFELA